MFNIIAKIKLFRAVLNKFGRLLRIGARYLWKLKGRDLLSYTVSIKLTQVS